MLALRLDYDLVFATTTPLTDGIPGIFARYFRGKPFVFEVRDLWPELPRAMGVVKNPLVLDRGRKDIVLAFIGDGKLKPHLMERARAERLDNCRFIDPIPKNQLNRLVSCCDIGMMILDDVPAFYYGTSPNKFFDYISSGLPVLNNYPGWLAEERFSRERLADEFVRWIEGERS